MNSTLSNPQSSPARPRGRSASKPAPGLLKFGPSDDFYRELRRRIDGHFEQTGLRRRDCPSMYLKSAIILAWFAASYGLLVFSAAPWWLVAPLTISLGLAMAAIGFNVQHDGSHRAFSERPWINKLAALSLDLLGGSSYLWAKKHNSIHHSYSNITGHDADLEIGPFGRLTPHQPRAAFHRMQHFYLWALYGMLPIKWQLYDDFRDLIQGKVGAHRVPRPAGWDLAILLGGKAVFFTFALVLPMLYHPAWAVLLCYVGASFVQGLTLSVVFQLAHCVEEAAFPLPREETGRMESDWAVHQVETSADFARGNRLVSWFVGGLNYQIEHHLFPQICHVHYPSLAPIVEATCREFGLKYAVNESVAAGVASHYRWLRRLGRG